MLLTAHCLLPTAHGFPSTIFLTNTVRREHYLDSLFGDTRSTKIILKRFEPIAMTGTKPVLETSFSNLQLMRRGKVRDVYEVDDAHLLIVATDRISAFDCILPTPIARKGEVLTALSRFWFEKLGHIVPNHLLTTDGGEMPGAVRQCDETLEGRSMLVHRTEVFPVECVVRGYIAGSGWKDYLRTGEVCGHQSARRVERIRPTAGTDLHARD